MENAKTKNKTSVEVKASELSSHAGDVERIGDSQAPGEARESDSESDLNASGAYSLPSVSSQRHKKSRGTLKRPRLQDGRGSSSNAQEGPVPKISTAARGRGKGKGSARVADDLSEPTDGQATDSSALVRAAPSDSSDMEMSGGEGTDGERGSASLRKTVVEALRMVASKRSQSARNGMLKNAELAIITAAGHKNLAGRQIVVLQKELAEMRQELTRLTAANAVLETELRSAKAELADVRGGRSQIAQPADSNLLSLLKREMASLQQRFDVLEGRLLRPSLAASKSAPISFAAAAAKSPASLGSQGKSLAQAREAPLARVVSSPSVKDSAAPLVRTPASKKRKDTASQLTGDTTRVTPVPPSGSLAGCGEWQTVGEARGAAKEARKRRKKEQQQRRKEKRAETKLLAPKNAAVVITLLPDAAKSGVTYGELLTKIKGMVTPAEFGAPDGFAVKVTATGARLLEVPGEASGPYADALAERLRTCLGTEEARVSRPTKCLDLRIMGLDDSVTEEEVVAAVVRTGECPADQVKVGPLRPDKSGLRTVVVSCPVTAAKKIKESKRLLVGWVSAQVRLLEPRPLRCFRCHIGDHVSAKCTSEVDRSDLCFRCGQPGHRANSCTAPPHCEACAVAGKPANHRVGSKACSPPTKPRVRGRFSTTNVESAVVPAVVEAVATTPDTGAVTATTLEETVMDC